MGGVDGGRGGLSTAPADMNAGGLGAMQSSILGANPSTSSKRARSVIRSKMARDVVALKKTYNDLKMVNDVKEGRMKKQKAAYDETEETMRQSDLVELMG